MPAFIEFAQQVGSGLNELVAQIGHVLSVMRAQISAFFREIFARLREIFRAFINTLRHAILFLWTTFKAIGLQIYRSFKQYVFCPILRFIRFVFNVTKTSVRTMAIATYRLLQIMLPSWLRLEEGARFSEQGFIPIIFLFIPVVLPVSVVVLVLACVTDAMKIVQNSVLSGIDAFKLCANLFLHSNDAFSFSEDGLRSYCEQFGFGWPGVIIGGMLAVVLAWPCILVGRIFSQSVKSFKRALCEAADIGFKEQVCDENIPLLHSASPVKYHPLGVVGAFFGGCLGFLFSIIQHTLIGGRWAMLKMMNCCLQGTNWHSRNMHSDLSYDQRSAFGKSIGCFGNIIGGVLGLCLGILARSLHFLKSFLSQTLESFLTASCVALYYGLNPIWMRAQGTDNTVWSMKLGYRDWTIGILGTLAGIAFGLCLNILLHTVLGASRSMLCCIVWSMKKTACLKNTTKKMEAWCSTIDKISSRIGRYFFGLGGLLVGVVMGVICAGSILLTDRFIKGISSFVRDVSIGFQCMYEQCKRNFNVAVNVRVSMFQWAMRLDENDRMAEPVDGDPEYRNCFSNVLGYCIGGVLGTVAIIGVFIRHVLWNSLLSGWRGLKEVANLVLRDFEQCQNTLFSDQRARHRIYGFGLPGVAFSFSIGGILTLTFMGVRRVLLQSIQSFQSTFVRVNHLGFKASSHSLTGNAQLTNNTQNDENATNSSNHQKYSCCLLDGLGIVIGSCLGGVLALCMRFFLHNIDTMIYAIGSWLVWGYGRSNLMGNSRLLRFSFEVDQRKRYLWAIYVVGASGLLFGSIVGAPLAAFIGLKRLIVWIGHFLCNQLRRVWNIISPVLTRAAVALKHSIICVGRFLGNQIERAWNAIYFVLVKALNFMCCVFGSIKNLLVQVGTQTKAYASYLVRGSLNDAFGTELFQVEFPLQLNVAYRQGARFLGTAFALPVLFFSAAIFALRKVVPVISAVFVACVSFPIYFPLKLIARLSRTCFQHSKFNENANHLGPGPSSTSTEGDHSEATKSIDSIADVRKRLIALYKALNYAGEFTPGTTIQFAAGSDSDDEDVSLNLNNYLNQHEDSWRRFLMRSATLNARSKPEQLLRKFFEKDSNRSSNFKDFNELKEYFQYNAVVKNLENYYAGCAGGTKAGEQVCRIADFIMQSVFLGNSEVEVPANLYQPQSAYTPILFSCKRITPPQNNDSDEEMQRAYFGN